MARKPIYQGILQSNLKGDTHTIGYEDSPLGGLAIGYKTVREVCIAKRTGGKTGSGSYDDPWAANTMAQFDAIMTNPTKAMRTNTIIRIRDGEFETAGSNAWNLQAGCKLLGESSKSTTLKLPDGLVIPNYGNNVVSHSSSVIVGDGSYVGDLKIDGNAHNVVNAYPGKVNGVVLYGNNTMVERVHITNMCGWISSFQEAFGILLQGTTGAGVSRGQTIRDCIADSFRGDYGGALVVSGPLGTPCSGGLITGCQVYDYKPILGLNAYKSVNSIGCLGGVISHNLMKGCQGGVYIEDGGPLKIIGNEFLEHREIAIFFNAPASPGHISDFQVIGNIIELSTVSDTYLYGMLFADDLGSHQVKNAQVMGNIIRLLNISAGPVARAGFAMAGASTNRGCQFIGNLVDVGLNNTNVVADSYCMGNRNLTGGKWEDQIPDSIDTGTVPSDEAYSSTWNGSQVSPTKNVLWDELNSRQQHASFNPTTAGWYRICTGVSDFAGTIRILASSDTSLSDVEFTFDGEGYNQFDGTINQIRSQHDNNNRVVTYARLSNNGAGSCALDIYVNYVADVDLISVYGQGPMLGTLVSSPTVGVPSLGFRVITSNFTKGLGSTYGLVVDSVGVVGKRSFGWTNMSGSGSKGALTAAAAGDASNTYVEAEAQAALDRIAAIEARLKSYDDMLFTHGLIGTA